MSIAESGPGSEEPNFNERDQEFLNSISNHTAPEEFKYAPKERAYEPMPDGYQRVIKKVINAWDNFDPRDKFYAKAITVSTAATPYTAILFRRPGEIVPDGIIATLGIGLFWLIKAARIELKKDNNEDSSPTE